MPVMVYIVLRKVHWFWKIDKWEYVGCYHKEKLVDYIDGVYAGCIKIISIPTYRKSEMIRRYKRK